MTTETEELSLHEELHAAFQASEAEAPEPISNRDEQGRFVERAESKETEAADVGSEDQPKSDTTEVKVPDSSEAPGNWKEDKAPQSWTPKMREKWGELPQDVRQEIVRREEAAVAGFRQLNEKFAPAQRVMEGLAPVFQETQQFGVDPVQHIGNVMQTERILRTADVKGKFAAIMQIADQYGVPLRDIINESVGEKVFPSAAQQQAATIPPQVERELAEMRAWRQEQSTNSAKAVVDAFAAGKEFFQDVAPLMGTLMDSGAAKDLQSAYDQACWMNPEVREVLIQRQTGQQQKTNLQDRQARATAASLPSRGKVDVKVDNGDEDDLAATVANAIHELNGRV